MLTLARGRKGDANEPAVRPQPINLIHAEILAVVSAMRKNQRWAPTSSSSYTPYPFPSTSAQQQQQLLPSGIALRGNSGAKGRSAQAQNNAGLMSGFMALKMELRASDGARRCVPVPRCPRNDADTHLRAQTSTISTRSCC